MRNVLFALITRRVYIMIKNNSIFSTKPPLSFLLDFLQKSTVYPTQGGSTYARDLFLSTPQPHYSQTTITLFI